jgi:hypothetical protein
VFQYSSTDPANPGGYFGEPDCRLHGLNLAEKWTDIIEFIMTPVLKQTGGLRGDVPIVGACQGSPLVNLTTEFVDPGGYIVLLFFAGKTQAFIEDHLLLNCVGSTPAGLGDGCNELGATAGFDYLLCRLALIVKFPVTCWVFVGRIEDGVIEEIAFQLLSSLSKARS